MIDPKTLELAHSILDVALAHHVAADTGHEAPVQLAYERLQLQDLIEADYDGAGNVRIRLAPLQAAICCPLVYLVGMLAAAQGRTVDDVIADTREALEAQTRL